MSILPQPTPVSPVIVNVVNQIKGANGQLYKTIVQQIAMIFNLIWNNKSFTPVQIVTAFGTDAGTLFTVFAQLQQTAQLIDPTYTPLVPPSQYIVVVNADGTVTLTPVTPAS